MSSMSVKMARRLWRSWQVLDNTRNRVSTVDNFDVRALLPNTRRVSIIVIIVTVVIIR